MANATSTQLQELYVAYFGRAADPTGLDYWTESGISQAAFAADMYAQNEFKSAYGSKSVEAQVNQIYKNLFDREADVTGLTYWTQEINLGNLKVAEIATHLIWAAQNNDGSSADKTALSNRTAAAIAYTAEVKKSTSGILAYQAQSTDPWVSGSNITEAVTYLSGIDGTTAHTAAGVTASVATITGNGDPTGIGSTFVLTTNTDTAGTTTASNGTISSNFRFTDGGNESITADIGTLQGADTFLDGSSSDSDVMNITANGNTNTFTANRIEKFVVDMAAGTPVFDVTNVTNFNTIEVKGTVAGTIDELDAQSKQPNIKLDGYTRVLTIAAEAMSGTTTASTAETINVELSGATHGTTAATQTGVTITGDGAGTLETLNITSSGSAANDFTLHPHTNGAVTTVNFLGATDLTTRVAATDVTGKTLTATAATGTQTLKIDNTGQLTTAVNTNLFTGFDNYVIIDSASPGTGGDGGSVSGLTSGQKITFGDDLNAATLSFKSVSGSSDTATIVLDNETADTDTDMTSIDIQNVETVTIQSSGYASTTQTAAKVNTINDFTGDATTVTITGDTTLDLDLHIDNASSGTRAVTADASGATGAVDIVTEASTGTGAVSYTLIGTANADVLDNSANANGGTLTGGAGNDTISGGTGNSTIDAGAGVDTIHGSAGTDTIDISASTDAVDTIVFNEVDEAAVASTYTLTVGGTYTAADTISITIGSSTETYTITGADLEGTNAAKDLVNITASLASFVEQRFAGVTATANSGTIVTLTADTDVDATLGTITETISSTNGTFAAATTAAGNDAVAVASAITGFQTGTTDDVISVSITAINAAITNLNESNGAVAASDDVSIIDYTTGTALATGDIAAAANLIKVAYDNSINAFSDVATDLGTSSIELDSAMDVDDYFAAVYYDADAGNAVFGFMYLSDAQDATLDGDTNFNEIATIEMTTDQYSDLGASNFAFIA